MFVYMEGVSVVAGEIILQQSSKHDIERLCITVSQQLLVID